MQKLQTRTLVALSALIISYIFCGMYREHIAAWDSKIIDQLFELRPIFAPGKNENADNVIHVDANLYSSRPQHANVIRNLSSMQVSAQLIDFILTDMVSPVDDQPLIDATLKAGNVYFGLTFELLKRQVGEKKEAPLGEGVHFADSKKWQVVFDGDPQFFWVGSKPRLPYHSLASASQGLGFLNLTPDPDGIIRRLPLLIQYEDVFYPSLSFRVVCDYLKVSPAQVIVTPGRSITLNRAQAADGTGPRDIVIPIDQSGNMILDISETWNSIPHYSYSEISQASETKANSDNFKKKLAGKIAVLSETDEKIYRTRTTGSQKFLPSGAIHALVLQNILSGSFLRELPQYAAVLIEIGLLVMVIFLSVRFSSAPLFLGTMALAATYTFLAAAFFCYSGLIFLFMRPLLILLFALSALLIGLGIERAVLSAQTERARKIAERELEIGRQIQSGFFPTSLPVPKGWQLATHFQAAGHVSGDFYDVFTLGEDKKVGLVIADVCDKGVGAALFMALFRSFIRVLSGAARSDGHLEIEKHVTDPGEILQKTIRSINNYISITHEKAGMFATVFYAILDPETGILTYINGGHEPPIIIGAGGIKTNLDPTGPAVGLYPDLEFKTRTVKIEREAVLLFFTDGVTDALNKSGEAFTRKRLQRLVLESSLSAEGLINKINSQLNAHILSEEQYDDITIMALRRVS